MRVGRLIAATHVKILPKAIRALLIHKFAPQLLVIDAAYCAGCRIKLTR